MKKIILTFTLLLFVCTVSLSQRTLQIVSDPMSNPFDVAVVGNSVYVAESGGTTLRRYDGTLTSIPYPVEGSRQFTYESQFGSILPYDGSLYLALYHGGGPLQHFFEFNGTDFRSFPIEAVSNVVVYQNRIYMLGMRIGVAEGPTLLSYDGDEWRVTPVEGLGSHHHRLFVGGGYLYIQSGGDFVHQYSESGIRRITGLSDNTLFEILPVSGTENVYFSFGFGGDIYFYDGTTATRITGPTETWEATGAVLSGDVLYFQSADFVTDEDPPCVLMRCVGAACSEVPIPEGSLLYGAEYAIYRHELYLPIRIGGVDYIYRYDGTAFTEIFEIPVSSAFRPTLSVRAAKLLIRPNIWESGTAYEYDGTGTIPIQSPGGEWLYETHQTTACYHTWTLRYRDESTPVNPYRYVLAIEVLYPDCTPEASVPIIPGLLQELERFRYGSYARDREWTWTEIDADWVEPICLTPPCVDVPPEGIQASLMDSKGQLAYSKIFDKPFSTKFPVDDKEPYTLSVSAGKDDKFDPVLIFDNDLVNKGIENVSFDMYPKEGHFYLKVDTRKQQQVPISLTLRNTKGESIWQENYTAPMDKLIRAYVSEPGAYLQVSLQQETSGVNYYPNPFKENLTLEVAEGTAPVSMSLSDLNGKVMFQTKIPGPGKHSINVGAQKSGLYILTIVEGNLTRRELVKIE